MKKPGSREAAPYYKHYIGLNKDGNVVLNLSKQISELKKAFGSVSEKNGTYRYAKGKWSVKELLGHVIDAERIFSYRALRISRKDKTNLPGFEENYYVKNSNFEKRKFKDLIKEFTDVRKANVIMIKSLDEKMLSHRGFANNHGVTARAIVFIMYGHTKHHIQILKERYIANLKK